jgi:hypothetical protein
MSLSVVKYTLVEVTEVTVAFLAVAMFHCFELSQVAGRLTLLRMRILSPGRKGVAGVVEIDVGCVGVPQDMEFDRCCFCVC